MNQKPHKSVPDSNYGGEVRVGDSRRKPSVTKQQQHTVAPSFGQGVSSASTTSETIVRKLRIESFCPPAANDKVIRQSTIPQISLAQANTIFERRYEWSKEQFMKYIEDMTAQDRWIAGRIYHNGLEVTKESFNQLRTDSNHVVDLKRFIQMHPRLTYEYKMTDINLRATFGIRPLQEYINFVDLFERVGMKGRSYLSPIQPDVRGLFKIAQSPLVDLPKATIKAIVRYELDILHRLLETKTESLSSLIPSVKAWAVCSDLPQSIAEKVGEAPSIDRMAAAIAWTEASTMQSVSQINQRIVSKTDRFWSAYESLKRMDKQEVLVRYSNLITDYSGCQRVVQEYFPSWSRDEQRVLSKELAATFITSENRRANIAEIIRNLNVGVWKKARRSLPPDTALKASLIFRDVATYESVCTKFGVTELFRSTKGNSAESELQPIVPSYNTRERVDCYFTAVVPCETHMHAGSNS